MPKYRARLPASLHLIDCRSRFPIRSQAARWHFLATCSRTTTAPAFLQFAYTHSLALHSPCFLFIVSRSAREFRKRWMLHGSRARTLQNIVFESALFFVLPFVRLEMKKWSAPPRHTGEAKSAQRGRKSIFYGRTGYKRIWGNRISWPWKSAGKFGLWEQRKNTDLTFSCLFKIIPLCCACAVFSTRQIWSREKERYFSCFFFFYFLFCLDLQYNYFNGH